MQLNPSEINVLKDALEALSQGDGRGFDDRLWLGFGDECGPMFERLRKAKYIVASDEGVDLTRITDRGRELLSRMERKTRIET